MSETLSAEWQAWVVEGILDDEPASRLIGALVHRGLDRERAAAEVERLRLAPATIVAKQRAQRHRPAELASRLRRATRSLGRTTLDERRDVDGSTILDVYVAHSVPVVLRGWCAHWPAVGTWSPDWLAEHHGDAEVSVCEGRASDPTPDRNWQQHTRTTTLGDYAAMVTSTEGNDRYLIANHRNLAGSLSALLDDLDPDPAIVRTESLAGNVSLWFGPAGTVTPTHHDTTNILFCQLYGTKRFWLAPPDETRLAAARDGFYSPIVLSDDRVMLEGGALSGGKVYEVTLEPGDTLLIPVGWWHEVRSLTPSISTSVVGLRFPNRFDWYTPGFDRPPPTAGPHG
jgi:hypothetical protein